MEELNQNSVQQTQNATENKTIQQPEQCKKGLTAKGVFKTMFATLLSAIFIFVICTGLTALISPITLANLCSQLELKTISAYLTKAQFERTKDINDLGLLVERSVISNSFEICQPYSEKLINHEDFSAFVNFKNQQNSEYNLNYENFVKGNYVYATCKNGDFEKAFENAKLYMLENIYISNNAISKFIDAYLESDKVFDVLRLNSYLETNFNSLKLYYQNCDELQKPVIKKYLKNISADLYILFKDQNNAEKTTFYKDFFNSL